MKNSLFILAFFFLASASALAQCGAFLTHQPVTCCNGAQVNLTVCPQLGTFCEVGTGSVITPCPGCQYLEPGDCTDAKVKNPFNYPNEWLARVDTQAFHDVVFGNARKVNFVTCSTDRSQFNQWLETQLQDQRKHI